MTDSDAAKKELNFTPKFDSSVAAKTVEVITGDKANAAEKEWVEANIASIREAVQQGRHSTLYYPASGRDILRPLVAFDADHLIAVDSSKQVIGEAEKQVRELGIEPKVEISEDGKRREITFELDGRQRRITEVQYDVRLVNPTSFGLEQIDILHIYLPTGATQAITEDEIYLKEKYGDEGYSMKYQPEVREEIRKDPTAPKPDPKTGNYKAVFAGMDDQLSPINYQMVAEGGFFVFGENRLGGHVMPPVLLEIIGLEEKQITARHPFTILTSFFRKPSELATMDRTGYIYQKAKTVDLEAIATFNDAVLNNFGTYYGFMEFERGNWWGLGLSQEEGMDVHVAVMKNYTELQEEVSGLGQRFVEAGVEESLVDRFKEASLEGYRTKVLTLQQQLAELLQAYGEMSVKYNAGEVNNQQVIEFMGIVFDKDERGNTTEVKNTKWPLASQLLLGSEEKSREVYELASQFVDSDFNF